MKKRTRRQFMGIGLAFGGFGITIREVGDSVDELVGDAPSTDSESERENDPTDIVIKRTSIDVYPYNKSDWDAEVFITVRNVSDKPYHVKIRVGILDEKGEQVDETKMLNFSIAEQSNVQRSLVWVDTDSFVRDGEEVEVKSVTVSTPGIFADNNPSTIYNTTKVVEDEN